MKLAHVSDLHLLPQASEVGGQGPSSLDVAMAIAQDLAAIATGLDLVIVSGDLTERGDAESFAAFERMFGDIGVPVLVVPGNHDGPAGMLDYVSRSPQMAGWHLTNRVIDIAGVRFLGLNTSIEGITQGAVDDTALALVDKEIHRSGELPLVIVMHHPPLLLGLARFDGFAQIDRGDELLALLQASAKEVIVLAGHVHRPYSARDGRLSCFVAGSMIAPFDSARPFGTDPIRPASLQDFYYVHQITSRGPHVVTPQRVRGLDSIQTR